MNLKKNLVLIGMMGSGKTTIGRQISKKLRLKFADSDIEIEKKEKISVREIFNKKGESYFRAIEEKITMQILNKNSNIISLGGGGFLNKKIQKKVLDKCISFWLHWEAPVIAKRIKNSKKRPLINDLSEDQIIELIYERSKVYEKADFKISCENLDQNEIVNKIIKIYENK